MTRLDDQIGPWHLPGPGSFSGDGRLYTTFDWNRGSVRIIEVNSGDEVGQFDVGLNGDEVTPVLSPDGRYVAWLANRSLHIGVVETGEVATADRELTGSLSDPWSSSLAFIPSTN